MSLRLGSILPRVFVVVVIAMLATATITFAAETHSGPATNPANSATSTTEILLVPDVRGQAYVFAKSSLEEAGFAWRVAGGARGYAANTVTGQSPAPGSRVYDTGAPTISLILTTNKRYPQAGTPEDAAPFTGTPVRLVGVVTKPSAKPKPKAKPRPKVKAKPVAKPKPAAKPKPKAKPKPAAKPKPQAKPSARPPAFVVPGAKPEPLDEIPLTTRARNLDTWLNTHRSPTNANVKYWLFQHAWIVTGARLGWWRGAEALETLIAVDQRIEKMWGIGKRSEQVARAALAEVRRKSK